MDRETELRRQLAALDREFRERSRPIIDELVEIENCKPHHAILMLANMQNPPSVPACVLEIIEQAQREMYDLTGVADFSIGLRRPT